MPDDKRAAGIYGRLGMTMIGESSWFMKVTENGKTISYSQWKIPGKALTELKHEGGEGIGDAVEEDTRRRLQEECDAECTADGEPKGLRLDVIEACTPASEAAQSKAFPQDEEYISKLSISIAFASGCLPLTLPQCSRKSRPCRLTKGRALEQCSRSELRPRARSACRRD